MGWFIIAYESDNGPRQQQLDAALDKFGAKQVTQTARIIETDASVEEIAYDIAGMPLDDADRIVIIRLNEDPSEWKLLNPLTHLETFFDH